MSFFKKSTPAPSKAQPAPAAKAAPPAPRSTKSEMEVYFDNFKQVSVKNGGDENVDSIQAGGFEAISQEMGIDVEDPGMLLLAWKCQATTPFSISREEWKGCMQRNGVDAMKKLKDLVTKWKRDVREQKDLFIQFYMFSFDFVREVNHKTLAFDMATAYWKMLIPMYKSWSVLEQYCNFIEAKFKKPITKDVWRQTFEFALLQNLQSYDPNGAWPTVIDDFVESLKTSS